MRSMYYFRLILILIPTLLSLYQRPSLDRACCIPSDLAVAAEAALGSRSGGGTSKDGDLVYVVVVVVLIIVIVVPSLPLSTH